MKKKSAAFATMVARGMVIMMKQVRNCLSHSLMFPANETRELSVYRPAEAISTGRTCRTRQSPKQFRRVVAVLAIAALMASSLALLPLTAPQALAATQITTTFTAGGESIYHIPAGSVSLQVTVVGAAGSTNSAGGAPPGSPGQGAEVQATIPVPSGVNTLYVEVGGVGGGGSSLYGGRGGGESAIQTQSGSSSYTADPSTDPRLVVAGGGGGGGENNFTSGQGTGGAGGSAGIYSSTTGPGAGGNGTDSGNGDNGSGAGLAVSSTPAGVGDGSPACGSAGNGSSGSPGQGGTGGDCNGGGCSDGGGGGGGWVGGSGGGAGNLYFSNNGAGGGGGAGASYVESGATGVSISPAGLSLSPRVVITANIAPAITSAGSATFTVGQSGAFTVTATGSPTPALSETGALPSGVTFADNGNGTATLSGTPASGTSGSYPLTIKASNGVSPDATQSFTLTVDRAARTFSASASPASIAYGNTVQLSATGLPPDATGTVTFSSNSLTLGTAVVSSGSASCATAVLAPGTYPVTATYSGDPNYSSATATTSFTIQAHNDATLSSLEYDNTPVSGFSPTTYNYNVTLPANTTTIPAVVATVYDTGLAHAAITQATSLPGSAKVVVTAQDGTTQSTYTINFYVAPPAQGLAINPPSCTNIGPLQVTISDSNPLSVWQSVYYSTAGDPETVSGATYLNRSLLPYIFTLSVSDTVYARVYDTSAGWGNLASETYTIVTPVPSIDTPVYSGSKVSVSGTAVDSASIVLYDTPKGSTAATQIGTATASATTGKWTISGLTLTAGDSLTTTAQASGLQVSAASSAVTVTTASSSNSGGGGGGSTPALVVTTTSLPEGIVGQSYSQTITTNNEGTAPYTFTVTSGSLPPGLTLDAPAGAVSGTPTTAGTYTFTITVKDANSNSANESYSLTVNSADGSAMVTQSAGGTVALGSNASINIPAGALQGSADVNVTIQSVTSPPAAPEGYSIIGAYEFTVNGQDHYTFNEPVTLTFHFDPSKVAKGTSPAIYYYDGTKWVFVTGTVDWTNDTITVTVNHFTEYAVVAQNSQQSTTTTTPTVTLKDIAGHWAEKNIEKLMAMGAISGYPDGTFKPDNSITRAEFATVLVKAFKLAPKQGTTFTDTANSWAKDYISTAAAYDIVKGYSDTSFGPDDPITREQMAVMIDKAAKLSPLSGELTFTDSGKISAWAHDSVFTAVKDGIMKGYPDNTFRPGGNATRAEAVTVIVNALK